MVRILLKQILSALNLVPSDLESIYNEYKHRNATPDTEVLIQTMYSAISRLSSVFILFDAPDECYNEYHDEIIAFIKHLKGDQSENYVYKSYQYSQDTRRDWNAGCSGDLCT